MFYLLIIASINLILRGNYFTIKMKENNKQETELDSRKIFNFASWNFKSSEILMQSTSDQFKLYNYNMISGTTNLKSIVSGNLIKIY